MELLNKKILVFGLGLTGLSALEALGDYCENLYVFDDSTIDTIQNKLAKQGINHVNILKDLSEVESMDLIIKSPGIKLDHPLLEKARGLSKIVISDIELAYNLKENNNFYGITGTNGKTTSTVLAGKIFSKWNSKTHIAGNVGVGVLGEIKNSGECDIFLLELSSFQLEHTIRFHPKIALILNITPDHIDWHGSFENYTNSKFKIFANQNKDDYLVLNYDDPILRNLEDKVETNIVFFSRKETLQEGIFLEDDRIVFRKNNISETIIQRNDIKLQGEHNIENIMGVIGLALCAGIPLEIIKEEISIFEGVEHRIEFVKEIRNTKYYNDSKGTNVESSIKGIQALNGPIILIAGGFDKGSLFDDLIKEFKTKGKALIVYGATKDKIIHAALKMEYSNVYPVDNLEDAVMKANSLAQNGDFVLFSPACASWDMYKNFEERGDHFKQLVLNLSE